jgi:hypothetical protein
MEYSEAEKRERKEKLTQRKVELSQIIVAATIHERSPCDLVKLSQIAGIRNFLPLFGGS